ncbi:hypothetical protein, partial [Salmonella enterica]|uniref:hypothetical protein n=1 Tax=Salmonella enterica TaxID=28901 RepID=UPI001C4E08D1
LFRSRFWSLFSVQTGTSQNKTRLSPVSSRRADGYQNWRRGRINTPGQPGNPAASDPGRANRQGNTTARQTRPLARVLAGESKKIPDQVDAPCSG